MITVDVDREDFGPADQVGSVFYQNTWFTPEDPSEREELYEYLGAWFWYVPQRSYYFGSHSDLCFVVPDWSSAISDRDVGPDVRFELNGEEFGAKKIEYDGYVEYEWDQPVRRSSTTHDGEVLTMEGFMVPVVVPDIPDVVDILGTIHNGEVSGVIDFIWEAQNIPDHHIGVHFGIVEKGGEVDIYLPISCYLEDDGEASIDLGHTFDLFQFEWMFFERRTVLQKIVDGWGPTYLTLGSSHLYHFVIE